MIAAVVDNDYIVEELSFDLIETILNCAKDREKGLTLSVTKIGNTDLGYSQPNKIVGGITKVVVNERIIGFGIETSQGHLSYTTRGLEARHAFLKWLNKANKSAVSHKNYGIGPGEMAQFGRSI